MQIYSPADRPADVPLDIDLAALIAPRCHAWSFWTGEYIGVVGKSYCARKLPAHGCLLLRLAQVRHLATWTASIRRLEAE